MLTSAEVKIKNKPLIHDGKTYEIVDAPNWDSCNGCVFFKRGSDQACLRKDNNASCSDGAWYFFKTTNCSDLESIFKLVPEQGVKKKLVL